MDYETMPFIIGGIFVFLFSLFVYEKKYKIITGKQKREYKEIVLY